MTVSPLASPHLRAREDARALLDHPVAPLEFAVVPGTGAAGAVMPPCRHSVILSSLGICSLRRKGQCATLQASYGREWGEVPVPVAGRST
jgi:hypothetical protein